MKIFTAVTKNKTPIVDVIAKDEATARKEIERQLSKPGRQFDLNRWNEDGREVKEAK